MLSLLNKFQKSRERRISRKKFEKGRSGQPDGCTEQPPCTADGAQDEHACRTHNIQYALLIDEWLHISAARFKRSTLSTYATVVSKHIKPALGNFYTDALTAEAISDFLHAKIYGGAGEPALAPSTVCNIVTVLRATFRHAENQGCTIRAWDALRRPTLVTNETKVLSPQERERLERHLCGNLNPECLGVLVCMYTGLRLGELCALKWGDISADCSTLTVRRTIQRIRNADYTDGAHSAKTMIVFDAPKSRSSNRTIPLPSFLINILKEHRCADDSFLLTGRAASFVEPRTFQNHFKGILHQAGVRDINFHALRHTFATNCVNLGFDVKTLSGILGHADVSVTLNTYVHPSLDQMRKYMERLSLPSGTPCRTS